MTLPRPRLLIIAGILIWCGAIFITPLIAWWEFPSSGISSRLYSFFSTVCHQIDARSVHLFGHKLAVCARCTGIYTGFLAGSIVSAFRPAGKGNPAVWWSAGLLPRAVDVILDITHIHSSSVLFRLATGGFFGIVAALILFPILITTFSRRNTHSLIQHGVLHEPETR